MLGAQKRVLASLRAVPAHIPKPDYALSGIVPPSSPYDTPASILTTNRKIYLFAKDEIPYMKEAGRDL
jgi:hypothetical protein